MVKICNRWDVSLSLFVTVATVMITWWFCRTCSLLSFIHWEQKSYLRDGIISINTSRLYTATWPPEISWFSRTMWWKLQILVTQRICTRGASMCRPKRSAVNVWSRIYLETLILKVVMKLGKMRIEHLFYSMNLDNAAVAVGIYWTAPTYGIFHWIRHLGLRGDLLGNFHDRGSAIPWT